MSTPTRSSPRRRPGLISSAGASRPSGRGCARCERSLTRPAAIWLRPALWTQTNSTSAAWAESDWASRASLLRSNRWRSMHASLPQTSIAVNILAVQQIATVVNAELPAAPRERTRATPTPEHLAAAAEGARRSGPPPAPQPDPGATRRRGVRLPPHRAARTERSRPSATISRCCSKPGSSSASSAAAGPTSASGPSRSPRSAISSASRRQLAAR